MKTIASLFAHKTWADAELLAAVSFTSTDGGAGCMSLEQMLLHVITHGGHHRGNVGQMLEGIGTTPPRDLYTRFLHLDPPARRDARSGAATEK